MEQQKFNRIAEDGFNALTALTTVARHGAITYNAYFRGVEVVVLGFQHEEDGHTLTKPVAILVNEEVFDQLRVDDEAGRTDGSGRDTAKKVL